MSELYTTCTENCLQKNVCRTYIYVENILEPYYMYTQHRVLKTYIQDVQQRKYTSSCI